MPENITTTGFVRKKFIITKSDKKDIELPVKKKQITVIRSEQVHVPYDSNISHLCHIAKNLYNQVQYEMRKVYFHNMHNPNDKQPMPTYEKLAKDFKTNENYRQLYSSTAQWTIHKVIDDWESYWKGMKSYKLTPSKFTGRPRIPDYKQKDGETLLIFTNQACHINNYTNFANGEGEKNKFLQIIKNKYGSIKEGENYLTFPTDYTGILPVKTRLDIKTDLREVRIVPQGKGEGYKVEIVYNKQVEIQQMDRTRIIGIDYGLRNIVSIANNIGEKCTVVKGGIAKSINQWYDKRRKELYSIYDRQPIACDVKTKRLMYNKYGKKLQKTTIHRNRIMKDIMHKISRYIINWCVEHNVGTIVIGHNEMWKQNIDLGRKTNLHFVTIPHDTLTKQLRYKAQEVGIDILTPNEAHTSKCSFLDNEPICHHDTYAGKRKGGLFKTAKGLIVNADVHAGANIIRSVFPNAFGKLDADGIVGTLTCPLRLSIKDLLNKKVSL